MTMATSAHSSSKCDEVRIGALVPLSRPGWFEAGCHLLAGMERAARDINDSGGILGRRVDLVVRDTAGDPRRASQDVDEFVQLRVAAIAGEYHSVVARAAAACSEAQGLPYLCSSAVIDALTEQPTEWVARLCPPQSLGWQVFAEYLLRAGHTRVAAFQDPSIYWASGARILRDAFDAGGGRFSVLETHALDLERGLRELIDTGATALLLLVGWPEPALSIVRAVRRQTPLARLLIGAPAGQPEFSEWEQALGKDGAGVPFLSYLPEQLSPLGEAVTGSLRAQLGRQPSFVALEGYDSMLVLAALLRARDADSSCNVPAWGSLRVEGTRGHVRFSRMSDRAAWQWPDAPIQVVDRDPTHTDRLRVLHAFTPSRVEMKD